MKTNVRIAIIGATLGLSALVLSGCQSYSLAPANQPVLVSDTINITPTIDWSRRSFAGREYWTVDGPALQELAFYTNLEDGDSIFQVYTQVDQGEDGEAPSFRSNMDFLEVSELLHESFNRLGVQKFAYSEMLQKKFGGHDGFRFAFSYLTKDGLEKQGIATGTLIDGKLNLAVYTGAKEYYFDKYKDAVERTLATAQFQPV